MSRDDLRAQQRRDECRARCGFRALCGKRFPQPEDRLCEPTQTAQAHGVLYSLTGDQNSVPSCVWWLRSPADRLANAMQVYCDSTEIFSDVHFSNAAVRPALWVNAEAVGLK